MKIENYQAADFLPLTADKPTKPGFYVAEISPEKWLVCVWRKANGQLMTKIGGKTCKVDNLKASWCPLVLQADLTELKAQVRDSENAVRIFKAKAKEEKDSVAAAKTLMRFACNNIARELRNLKDFYLER